MAFNSGPTGSIGAAVANLVCSLAAAFAGRLASAGLSRFSSSPAVEIFFGCCESPYAVTTQGTVQLSFKDCELDKRNIELLSADKNFKAAVRTTLAASSVLKDPVLELSKNPQPQLVSSEGGKKEVMPAFKIVLRAATVASAALQKTSTQVASHTHAQSTTAPDPSGDEGRKELIDENIWGILFGGDDLVKANSDGLIRAIDEAGKLFHIRPDAFKSAAKGVAKAFDACGKPVDVNITQLTIVSNPLVQAASAPFVPTADLSPFAIRGTTGLV